MKSPIILEQFNFKPRRMLHACVVVFSTKAKCLFLLEVKHDVYGKRQTAKMKLLPSPFSC